MGFDREESGSKDNLLTKLHDRSACIGIVGMGYVGLPLSLTFAENGYKVLGIDIDERKVHSISLGQTYIKHINGQRIKSAVSSGTLHATNNFEEAKNADALILCVPTPLNKYREPDLSYITQTMQSLLPNLNKGTVISLESTTYPGTTEEILRPMLEKIGFIVGLDIYLVYSPEREDPGNTEFSTATIPKVLGGSTAACKEIGIALYEQVICRVVAVSNTQTAEMTKLLENIHRAVNIGLVNELKPLADRMGIDLYEVIRAAATKPFGFVPYFPGPGLGGHCIPIDPFYLTWKAREFGLSTRFIELAGEINTKMPHYVVEKTSDALNNHGKPLKKSRILILGIAYKKNVDDIRESPSVEIMELLQQKGAFVEYSDPYFPVFPPMRRHNFNLSSVLLTGEIVASYDACILATDHDNFDYLLIGTYAVLLIDSRGKMQPGQNVIRA